jgi:hypothetical protein
MLKSSSLPAFKLGSWQARDFAPPLLIFVIALAIRGITLYCAHLQLSTEHFLASCPDTVNYVTCAKGVLTAWSDKERGLFAFGPGYPLWLAAHFGLFGVTPWPILIGQVLMSSLSAVLVYFLALRIILSRVIATVAGLLATVCITSTMLSCFLLSDTLYLFLLLTGLALTVEGLRVGKLQFLACAGVIFGYAVLVRSIGQFWIFPLLALVVGLTLRRNLSGFWGRDRRFLVRAGVLLCAGILMLQVGWMARNRVVHGAWAIAFTGAGAPATVAAMSLHPDDEWNFRVTMAAWDKEYRDTHHDSVSTPGQNYHWLQQKAWETFQNCPSCVIKAYLHLTWANLNDVDYLHELLLPAWKQSTESIQNFVRGRHLNQLSWMLSCLGAVILLVTGSFRALFVLGVIYAYFAAMIGAYPWQGSRYFYPGHLAADMLTAVTLYFIACIAWHMVKALWEARDKFA